MTPLQPASSLPAFARRDIAAPTAFCWTLDSYPDTFCDPAGRFLECLLYGPIEIGISTKIKAQTPFPGRLRPVVVSIRTLRLASI